MERVSFIHMKDGTADDYRIIGNGMKNANLTVAHDVLEQLQKTEDVDLGLKVTRFEHSLQSATHAFRAGESEEFVVAALLHDVGDALAPWNHAQLAAAILRPYVSERTWWVVLQHGLFQTYYYNHHFGRDRNARDHFKDHPHYQACVDFCDKYDQNCFDPNFDTMPLSAFEPMVQRVFSRTPNCDMATEAA